MYIVILSNLYPQGVAFVVTLDAQFNVISRGQMNEISIVQNVVGRGLQPLNFSVIDNKVVDNLGKFTRFGKPGEQRSVVAVARLLRRGKLVGYRVVATNNGVCANFKLADLFEMCKSQATPLVQNMMFRNNTLAEYSTAQIPTVEIPSEASEKVRHQVPVQKPTIDYDNVQTAMAAAKPSEVKQRTVPNVQAIVRNMDTKQQKEVSRAMKAGVDPALLADPKLTPQQMRVLWMSKQLGCKSEVFKNSDISVDTMKFYADRLYTDDMCDKCKPLLAHPELPLDEVSELYLCAMAGMDVNELIGKSATEIQIAHEGKTRDYWAENKIFGNDADYYQKALHVAMEAN